MSKNNTKGTPGKGIQANSKEKNDSTARVNAGREGQQDDVVLNQEETPHEAEGNTVGGEETQPVPRKRASLALIICRQLKPYKRLREKYLETKETLEKERKESEEIEIANAKAMESLEAAAEKSREELESQKNKELQSLRNSNRVETDSLHATISELKDRITKLNNEINDLSMQRDTIGVERDRALIGKRDAETDLKKLKQQMDGLRKTNATASDNERSLKKQLEDLQKSTESAMGDLKALLIRRDEHIEQLEDEKERLIESCDKLQKTLDDFLAINVDAARIADLEQKVRELEDTNGSLITQHQEELSAKETEFNAKIEDKIQDCVAGWQEKLQNAELKYEKLKKETGKAMTQKLEEANNEWQKKLEAARKEWQEELAAEKTRASKELEEAEQKLENEKESARLERNKLREKHRLRIDEMQAQHAQECEKLLQTAEEAVRKLRDDSETKIKAVREKAQADLSEERQLHKMEMEELTSRHTMQMEELSEKHISEKQELTATADCATERAEGLYVAYTKLLKSMLNNVKVELDDAYPKGRTDIIGRLIDSVLSENDMMTYSEFSKDLFMPAVDSTPERTVEALDAALREAYRTLLMPKRPTWLDALMRLDAMVSVDFIADQYMKNGLDVRAVHRAASNVVTLLRLAGITLNVPRLFEDTFDDGKYIAQPIKDIASQVEDVASHVTNQETIVDIFTLGYQSADGELSRRPAVSRLNA